MKWAKAYDFKSRQLTTKEILEHLLETIGSTPMGMILCRYGQTVQDVCEGRYSGWLPKGGKSSALLGDFLPGSNSAMLPSPRRPPLQGFLDIAILANSRDLVSAWTI